MKIEAKYTGLEIAITGMACHLPGAANWREFWDNLSKGVESIHFMTPAELAACEMTDSALRNKNYIGVTPNLKDKEYFDASFFDYTAVEAALMNPVHRFFHQCVWEALEDAGYDPERMKGTTGIYVGAGDDLNWRLYAHLMNQDGQIDDMSLYNLSNKDFLASLLSYKLNLKGPVVSVNTTCSTSLVAINLACKALLLGETDVALAGGITFRSEQQRGYFYQEGMIFSSDGHCRAFDRTATGTVATEGAGVVVLKRLNKAIEDGDMIYAIIKGGAVNNDGHRKVGFTAASVEGQVDCIRRAQKFARVTPETISYVETHGTGTRLGDPIEIEALNIAFNNNRDYKCAIGAVKTNIGHLDIAAGIAGLIKTVLSLKHRQIPASLNFKEPNPEVNFAGGPFYVNTELSEWLRRDEGPLRAGVSSFGIGGTNAHTILEEAPQPEITGPGRPYKLLTVSAKTSSAVTRYLDALKLFLEQQPSLNMSDMAYTLQVGRREFGYRKTLVFKDREELLRLLGSDPEKEAIIRTPDRSPSVIFLFPGQGSQYTAMGKGLYENEPVFREQMDNGFRLLKELTGESFEDILFGRDGQSYVPDKINETRYTQPLIFLVEYSLAMLLKSMGITARYMIGHSIGEYVAACISGVFSFEDALKVVARRGVLMNRLAPGLMLSIPLNASVAQRYLGERISLAAINGPEQVVLSGDLASMSALMAQLEREEVPFVKLHTSHAFHSSMLDPVMEDFRRELEQVTFYKTGAPFVSNLTGELVRGSEPCSADYWVRHLREPVRFTQGLQTILSQGKETIFIEVGAGHSLAGLLKQQKPGFHPAVFNLLRSAKEEKDDLLYLTTRLGNLWSHGLPIDWNNYYRQEKRQRVSLPTYRFEQVKYPTEVAPLEMLSINDTRHKEKKINDFFYRIVWKQSVSLPGNRIDYRNSQVLIFADSEGLGRHLEVALTRAGAHCRLVEAGTDYSQTTENSYHINPWLEKDYSLLFGDLAAAGFTPSHILHTWSYGGTTGVNFPGKEPADHYRETGYQSLLAIVRSFSATFRSPLLNIRVIGSGWYKVLRDEVTSPDKSITLAAVKLIPKEFQHITCQAIDIPDLSAPCLHELVSALDYAIEANEIAIRGKTIFVKDFEKIDFAPPPEGAAFREKGTYLITGANGGLGGLFANFLAQRYQANLILLGRSKIKQQLIDELEAKGSRVLSIEADIADAAIVEQRVADAELLLGSINGVIHAAGLADYAGVIVRRSRQEDDLVFAPKIGGMKALGKIFAGRSLDFLCCCSSGSASLAPFGQLAYIAANLYQDAFAEEASYPYPVISIEWPAIREIGMAVNSLGQNNPHSPTAHNPAAAEDPLRYGLNPSDAIPVLSTAIYLRLPVQVISTWDFAKAFRNSRVLLTAEEEDLQLDQVRERGDLPGHYIAPETDTEKRLAILIRRLLGIDKVGAEDSFFDLGGDSLKGMLLLKRIRGEFNVDLTLTDFFDGQTLRKMGRTIDQMGNLSKKQQRTSKIII